MRAKNMQALTDAIKRRHPGVVIYGIGDEAHKLRTSDHNEDDTPGVRAAQSDPDSNPEHRAIDVMLGPAFTKAQAHALVNDLLADPGARARLFYINFENWQWSRSNGWQRRDNSDDPHPDHIHISGWAADDENTAGWPAVDRTGGSDVYGTVIKGAAGDPAEFVQRACLQIDPKSLPKFGIDREYGGEVATAVARLFGGDGSKFGPAQYTAYNAKLASLYAGKPGVKGDKGDDGRDGVVPPGTRLLVESVIPPDAGTMVESGV